MSNIFLSVPHRKRVKDGKTLYEQCALCRMVKYAAVGPSGAHRQHGSTAVLGQVVVVGGRPARGATPWHAAAQILGPNSQAELIFEAEVFQVQRALLAMMLLGEANS